MIYRYTIGSVCCVLGSLALFWFTRTPHPAPGVPASTRPPEPAHHAPSLEAPPRSPSSPAAPAVISLAPETLTAELRGLPTNGCGGECERTLRDLAGRLGVEGLPAALEAGDTILGADSRRVWRQLLLTRMAEGSSETALHAVAYARSLTSPLEREDAFRVVLTTRARQQPQEAWNWFLGHRSLLAEDSSLVVDLPAQIAQMNPGIARALGEAMPAGDERDQMLAGVALGWAGRNFAEAIQWTRTLPPENQQQILLGLAPRWVEQDFAAAATHATSLPPGEERAEFIATVVRAGAQTKLAETLEWWKGQPAGAERDQSLVEMATQWARQSFDKSVDFVTRLPESSARDDALVAVIGEAARERPTTMAEWLKNFPESELRRNGMAKLAEQWAGSDPVAAAEWAATLPQEQASPQISSAVALGLYTTDPAVAVQWLQSIGDDGVRHSTLIEMLSRHDDASALVSRLAPELNELSPPPLEGEPGTPN